MLSVSNASFAAKRFELLTLGDELLLGLTTNGHLAFIGAQLGRRGVTLQRNVTLTDDAAAIAAQFRESWARSDVVITTGGLGPTCDDRTRETIAEVLGQKLIFDPAVEKVIAERFARHGRKMPPNNLKQAHRPERAEVLPNANGTAPGLWIEQDGKVLCLLPGPPNELQPMFTEQVLPRLARLGLLLDHEAYVQIRASGIGESALEAKLQPLFDRHGDALSVAFCAHTGHVDCRLSSPGEKLPFDKLQAVADDCAQLLREDFVCFGHDSLAKVCADHLRAQEKTLAVAEAATGGLLANAFTDICGAAKFFAGGCVCCPNDAKTQLLDVPECLLLQHGAVSAETAVAMATGAAEKLGADYAVAITGFAGPCGGTKENPIGTIYLALHAPHGVWSKRLSYPGPRRTVQERAVNAALDWLRRELVRAQAGLVAPVPNLGVPQ
ncbi:MAG TPA: CinA family nicotinamide mononucleotide deamidase-related protein [Opitutaceae bacterium]|jgi:nicotinamide-nucleotide amidase|nr:CinA family nicotinamide mononucleotide deamidase-related protein [Opitutaceae bacterium]